MKNKKADLSLSINAIVILILAITMLGLGLTFMRGLFKQATAKVESAVSGQELTNPPTTDNVMTITPGSVTLRTKDVETGLIAFMNTKEAKYCALRVYDSAAPTTPIDPSPATGAAKIVYNPGATTQPMSIDQINTWTLSIVGSQGTAGTTKVFTSIMCCDTTLTDLPATAPLGSCDATSPKLNLFYKKDIIATYTS